VRMAGGVSFLIGLVVYLSSFFMGGTPAQERTGQVGLSPRSA
jgi:hypothetical protein